MSSKGATYLTKSLLDGTSDAQSPDSANAQSIVFHPAKIYGAANPSGVAVSDMAR